MVLLDARQLSTYLSNQRAANAIRVRRRQSAQSRSLTVQLVSAPVRKFKNEMPLALAERATFYPSSLSASNNLCTRRNTPILINNIPGEIHDYRVDMHSSRPCAHPPIFFLVSILEDLGYLLPAPLSELADLVWLDLVRKYSQSIIKQDYKARPLFTDRLMSFQSTLTAPVFGKQHFMISNVYIVPHSS